MAEDNPFRKPQQGPRRVPAKRPPSGRSALPAFGAVLLIALVVLWWFRPLLHGFAMFFYTAPIVWLPPLIVFGIGAAVVVGRVRKGVSQEQSLQDPDGGLWVIGSDGIWRNRAVVWARAAGSLGAVAGAAFAAFVLGGLIQGPLTSQAIYNNTVYGPIKELPTTGAVRLIPKEVAERVAGSGFNSSTEHLTDFHIVRAGNRLDWTAIRTPDGLVRAFTQKSPGTLALDASTTSRTTKQFNGELQTSPGILFTDNLKWRLLKEHYLVELDDPIAITDAKSKPLLVVPYMQYKGLLIRRPVFGGVMVVHPDGTIEDLEPEQAFKRKELVAAGRLYPEQLALRRQEAYAYKNGIWNKWFLHEGQTQISNTETNPQPYVLDYGKKGTKFVTAAEPYGRAYAVNTIFLTDSVTGVMQLWRPAQQADLTGNRRVLETVRSLSIPGIVFADTGGTSGDRGGFRVVEPRPVQVDGALMFMASIIPDNANSVSKTVFIDAKSNRVVRIFNNDSDDNADAEIKAFLTDGTTQPGTEPTKTTDGKPTGATSTTGKPDKNADLRQQLDDLISKQQDLLDQTKDLRRNVK